MKFTICKHCDHFVEVDDFIADNTCVIHLEDGEQDFNHEPELSDNSMTLDEWKITRPDLFKMHQDGCIGPNSMFHSRRGKTS